MTRKLKANEDMRESLVYRQLSDLLVITRARAESDPGCGQIPKLNRAAQEMYAKRLEQAGTLIREAEKVLDERKQTAEAEANLQALAEQAARRGEEVVRVAKGPASRDGWLWLIQKKRVTRARQQAGDRYSTLYGRARSDGVRSCLNDDGPKGAAGSEAGPLAARMRALSDLKGIHTHIQRSVGEQPAQRFIALLDAVCGRGETLRALSSGDDRKALVVEADLMTALDFSSQCS